MKNKFLILTCFFILISSYVYSQNTDNQRFSMNKRLFKKLLKQNGNVFELVSPMREVSYIWTYQNNKIEIYFFAKGKKTHTSSFCLIDNSSEWLLQKDDRQYKLRDCIVTDGGILIFTIKSLENELIEKEYPIDIGCMKSINFSSNFYINLIRNMKEFKIGWQ